MAELTKQDLVDFEQTELKVEIKLTKATQVLARVTMVLATVTAFLIIVTMLKG